MFQQRAAKLVHSRTGGLDHHGAGRGLGGAAVELLEHRIHIGSDEIDDIEVESLLLRVSPGSRNGFLQGIAVAVPDLGNAADEGTGVLVDLSRERVRKICAPGANRRGRADVGARRHHGEVGRGRHKGSRRSRSGAGGRYVHRDGDLRFQESLDDFAGRVHEAARRVQADDGQRDAVLASLVESPRNVGGGQRLDGAVDLDDEHGGFVRPHRVGGLPRQKRDGCNNRRDPDQATHDRPPSGRTRESWRPELPGSILVETRSLRSTGGRRSPW